jgi:serine/threonine-protein phosphatase 2A regulatory subunit B'
VVVSPSANLPDNAEMPADPLPHIRSSYASPDRSNLTPIAGQNADLSPNSANTQHPGTAAHPSTMQPPKAGPLNRLRIGGITGTPGGKDGTPIGTVGKSPRKQRSSRFHVTEKIELEKLPNFMGASEGLFVRLDCG